jgi:hypothetical protein
MDREPFKETLYIEDPATYSKFREPFRGRCWKKYRTILSSKFRVHDPLEILVGASQKYTIQYHV